MTTVGSPRRAAVPVIDLFAGPGGLGEGFSALKNERVGFDVVLSVEKDEAAHSTLLLRSLYRALRATTHVDQYYRHLRGEITRENLYLRFKDEASRAHAQCLHLEMGPHTTHRVYSHLERALRGAKTWVLVGGPPCQAYSVVGRSRMAKIERAKFEKNEKHILYREYLRILARYLPPVFVMENVKGLLSAKYGGDSTFDRIISDLSSPTVAIHESTAGKTPLNRRGAEYSILCLSHPNHENNQPADYVVAAERYGVPQKRHRVILLGVRSDLIVPAGIGLRESPGPSVQDVLADLPLLRSQLSRENDNATAWINAIRRHMQDFRPQVIDEQVLARMRATLPCLAHATSTGGPCEPKIAGLALADSPLTRWLIDPKMGFVINHETRKHIAKDLIRYLFSASYAAVVGRSPKLHEFPAELLPEHQNVANSIEARHGLFNDRFRVQLADQPASTVTSHLSKDGHYFIHHDPAQCRSWTVREAARVQTFPDNYCFAGTRTDQFRQVGNAVPPYLALQVAQVVASIIDAQV